MIRTINTGNTGGYLHIENGYTNMPYVSTNSSNPLQGMIRLNNSNLEVFDGAGWQMISGGYPSISLSGTAVTALDWATKKMAEEAKRSEEHRLNSSHCG